MLLALVALLVTAGMAEATTDDVRKVNVDTTWANIRGQYGKVWSTLHPRYQQVTTRAFWEACKRKEARKGLGIEWLSVKATDDYPDRLTLPLLGTISVTAVSMEAKIDYLGIRRTVRDTVYWVKVDGEWRGLWEPIQYRAYKAKRCPS